jgi:hypothetical protein
MQPNITDPDHRRAAIVGGRDGLIDNPFIIVKLREVTRVEAPFEDPCLFANA